VASPARRPTISFVVPALNEEANIADAVREAVASMGDRFSDYELLLFDDGSTDRTGAIMDKLAAADPRHIRVTHNPSPRNLGGVYKQGIALARMDYLLMVPGDNENPGHALQAPFDAIGRADIVLPYPVNSQVRGSARHLVSRTYVGLRPVLQRHRHPPHRQPQGPLHQDGELRLPGGDPDQAPVRREELRRGADPHRSPQGGSPLAR
jgi:glycosyltransferase involved in cell wall biosynthesis